MFQESRGGLICFQILTSSRVISQLHFEWLSGCDLTFILELLIKVNSTVEFIITTDMLTAAWLELLAPLIRVCNYTLLCLMYVKYQYKYSICTLSPCSKQGCQCVVVLFKNTGVRKFLTFSDLLEHFSQIWPGYWWGHWDFCSFDSRVLGERDCWKLLSKQTQTLNERFFCFLRSRKVTPDESVDDILCISAIPDLGESCKNKLHFSDSGSVY